MNPVTDVVDQLLPVDAFTAGSTPVELHAGEAVHASRGQPEVLHVGSLPKRVLLKHGLEF